MLACKASAMRLLARQAGESSDHPALPIVQQFSGRGLLPNEIPNAPSFVHSVATGAAVTVFTATSLGFPISTTHALIGALVGAGLGQIGAEIYFEKLTQSFLVPLLVSAKVAASLGIVVYKLLQMRSAGRDGVCVVSVEPLPLLSVGRANFRVLTVPNLVVAETTAYENISAQARWSVSDAMDRLHIASALSICFARGVNDTPKLAALLITAKFFNRNASVALIGIAMAIGGLLYARRVAQTTSHRITRMKATQGLAANLITATLVMFANKCLALSNTCPICIVRVHASARSGQVSNKAKQEQT